MGRDCLVTMALSYEWESRSDRSLPPFVDEQLADYLHKQREKSSEHDKRAYFKSKVLVDWFDIDPAEIEIEKKNIDLWVNHNIVETKTDLSSERVVEGAKEQVMRYHDECVERGETVSRALITDCNIVYVYSFDEVGDVQLVKQDYFVLSELSGEEAYHRLYEAIFPRELNLSLTAKNVFNQFRVENHTDTIEQIYNDIDTDSINYLLKNKFIGESYGHALDNKDMKWDYSVQIYLYTLAVTISARKMGVDTSRSDELFDEAVFERAGVTGFIDSDSIFCVLDSETWDDVISVIDEQLELFDLDGNYVELFGLMYESSVLTGPEYKLGKYQTDEQAAQKMVDTVVDKWSVDNVFLEPAVGTGTELIEMVDKMVDHGFSSENICRRLIAFDVNPISVVIARCNFVLKMREAFGDDVEITVPIYMADSLAPQADFEPRVNQKLIGDTGKAVRVELGSIVPMDDVYDKDMFVDTKADVAHIEKQIDVMIAIAQGKYNTITEAKQQMKSLPQYDESQLLLEENVEFVRMLKRINTEYDIAPFRYVLKNVYRPEYYYESVDVVFGSPPLYTIKHVTLSERQNELEKLYKLYDMNSGNENKGQYDMGTFFTARCAEYCSGTPRIAFMGNSTVLNGSQYDSVRRMTWNGPALDSMIRIPGVTPFRNVNYLLFFEGWEMDDEVPCEWVTDYDTPTDNVTYYVNTLSGYSALTHRKNITTNKKQSPYHSLFRQGAIIQPRPYVCMEIVDSPRNTDEVVEVRTRPEHRNTESKYSGVSDPVLVPRSVLHECLPNQNISQGEVGETRPVMLPVVYDKDNDEYNVVFTASVNKNSYTLNLVMDAREKLFSKPDKTCDKQQRAIENYVSLWNEFENEWETVKEDKITITREDPLSNSVVGNILYRGKLTAQKQEYKYVVLMKKSSKRPVAAYTDKKMVVSEGFYRYYTENKIEAEYLCAILNSEYVKTLLGRFGLLSKPDTAKIPLDLPIPKFSWNHEQARRLMIETTKSTDEQDEDVIEECVQGLLTNTTITLNDTDRTNQRLTL